MPSVLLTCALLLPAAADADLSSPDDAAVAAQADAAFTEGVALRDDADKARPCFRRAADCYEELLRRGVANPALYRDLGNALLLADDLPGAVLAYRRGLRLAPRDEELRQSLESARSQVEAPPARPAEQRPSAWTLLRPGWWLGGAAVLYGLACVGVTRWRMTRRTAPLGGAVLLLAAVCFLAGGGVLSARAGRGDPRPVVVIARDRTPLYQGNNTAYPRRIDAPLNAGVEAVLLVERDGWLQIELADGVVGWVPADRARVDRGV